MLYFGRMPFLLMLPAIFVKHFFQLYRGMILFILLQLASMWCIHNEMAFYVLNLIVHWYKSYWWMIAYAFNDASSSGSFMKGILFCEIWNFSSLSVVKVNIWKFYWYFCLNYEGPDFRKSSMPCFSHFLCPCNIWDPFFS